MDGGLHTCTLDPHTQYLVCSSTFADSLLSNMVCLWSVCLQALYDEMKFERPSKIQASTLPMILRRSEQGVYRDLIAQAHNGSGKTTCFVLAMLSR
jgi:superfamily II DNA/RNA helicase